MFDNCHHISELFIGVVALLGLTPQNHRIDGITEEDKERDRESSQEVF